ncbi:MAG: GDSL-type esterase/lipase family protein [Verrucomicrobia bacterium]|nr:GDSL-type esterase/lipase family protein [Verrucomicrobiota bacterium]
MKPNTTSKQLVLQTSLALWLLVAAATGAEQTSLRLTLPPTWYGVPGVPISLYYDNIVLTEKPESYRFEVTCDIGRSEAKRWTVTPTDKDVGQHAFGVVVKSAQGKELQRAKTMLRIAPKDAGVNRNLRLLIVGDSLTHATIYPNEIGRLLSEPGNPKWTMLGTHKPASVKPGVAHEGYGGWTWAAFLTRYDAKLDHKLDEKGRRLSSPFLFPGADGKPALDIPRYFRENCAGQPPDVMTVLLGINDCFGASPDNAKTMDAHIAGTLDTAEKFLKAFRAAAPRTVFAIGLTTPPNSRESGFEANYKGKYHRWGWKRIQHRLVEQMLKRFAGREREGIHLVPTELNLDPVDGYPDNNGVHPNATGYQQIGASFYCWLKWWLQAKQQ